MFERFTDAARHVVVLAQEEARALNHPHIGTEHLLLATLHLRDSVAAMALISLGASLEAVRQQVEVVTGRGERSPDAHIPFTTRGKKVLEFALREALQLQHNHIGTEHILLGILREDEGLAVQVLKKLGVDPEAARERVMELLAGVGDEPLQQEEQISTRMTARSGFSFVMEADSLSGDEPRCSRCNAPAAENLRTRVVVTPGSGEPNPDRVTLVWCGTCGAVFGASVAP